MRIRLFKQFISSIKEARKINKQSNLEVNLLNKGNMFEETLNCYYCDRIVPNKTFFTKRGCIWCDKKYWKD